MRPIVYAAACVLGLLFACYPQPAPVPPGPTPADPFGSAIINCTAPEVAQQEVAIESAVRDCLVGTATTVCLNGLYPGATVNSIACTVRQAGIDSNQRVLAKTPRPDDTTIDNAARSWLTQEHLGFRSTRP